MKINHIIDEAVSGKFVNPQAVAQDPGLEREKDVDVIIFGRMPQDFTYRSLIQALEAVLPREYPPGTSQNTQGVPSSPAELIGQQIAKHGGAVVTTKPLSTAQKVVKEFQARGIKCRIRNSGLEEAVEDYAGTYSPEAIAIGKKFCDQYNITDDTDVQLAVELIDAYLDEFKWRNIPVDLNVLKSKVAKDFRNVYRGMGPGPSFRKKFQEQGMAEGDVVRYTNRHGTSQVGIFSPNPREAKQALSRLNSLLKVRLFPEGDRLVDLGLVVQDEKLFSLIGYVEENFPERTDLRDFTPFRQRINKLISMAQQKLAQGVAEGTAGLPDPNNFDSDNDYRDALDAYATPQAMDADYENMISEPDDWFDESKEKVGNMDADAFDAALSRMKKLAGAGPLKTVYDPARRVYKNVPHAVQPAQQPKKSR